MNTSEVIGLLDRLNPPVVSIHWLLDDCYVIAGTEKIRIQRSDISNNENVLKARGYERTSVDIDQRGGMEGELIYQRK